MNSYQNFSTYYNVLNRVNDKEGFLELKNEIYTCLGFIEREDNTNFYEEYKEKKDLTKLNYIFSKNGKKSYKNEDQLDQYYIYLYYKNIYKEEVILEKIENRTATQKLETLIKEIFKDLISTIQYIIIYINIMYRTIYK